MTHREASDSLMSSKKYLLRGSNSKGMVLVGQIVEQGVSTVAEKDTTPSEFCGLQFLYKNRYHPNTTDSDHEPESIHRNSCDAAGSDTHEVRLGMDPRQRLQYTRPPSKRQGCSSWKPNCED